MKKGLTKNEMYALLLAVAVVTVGSIWYACSADDEITECVDNEDLSINSMIPRTRSASGDGGVEQTIGGSTTQTTDDHYCGIWSLARLLGGKNKEKEVRNKVKELYPSWKYGTPLQNDQIEAVGKALNVVSTYTSYKFVYKEHPQDTICIPINEQEILKLCISSGENPIDFARYILILSSHHCSVGINCNFEDKKFGILDINGNTSISFDNVEGIMY